MSIEVKKEMYQLLKDAVIHGIEIIKEVKERNESNPLYYIFRPHYYYPKISYTNNFPTCYLSDGPWSYHAFLMNNEEKYRVDNQHWESYKTFVLNNDDICKFYKIGKYTPKHLKSTAFPKDFHENIYTFGKIEELVDAYINTYGMEFIEEKFGSLFNKLYQYIFSNSLPVSIVTPILFVNFDFEEYELLPNVKIKKIDYDIQKSRLRHRDYKYVNKDVVASATHAFVLTNWNIEKTDNDSVWTSLNDINAYNSAKIIISNLFAALRISNPYIDTGYSQILAVPNNWQPYFEADLVHTFGVTERKYPNYFEEYNTVNNEKLGLNEAKKIQECLQSISNSQYLNLACKRLDKACLNNREDDAIIDISIALESLLTSDSKSEITYRLATRAALLNKKLQFKDYSSESIFKLCKKLYDFRSSVVHGDHKKQEKSRLIKIETEEPIQAVNLALEYLKHIIYSLTTLPNIKQAADIDRLLFD